MFDPEGTLRKLDPESSNNVSSNGLFFTVLIPTMNRPQRTAGAVSVLAHEPGTWL